MQTWRLRQHVSGSMLRWKNTHHKSYKPSISKQCYSQMAGSITENVSKLSFASERMQAAEHTHNYRTVLRINPNGYICSRRRPLHITQNGYMEDRSAYNISPNTIRALQSAWTLQIIPCHFQKTTTQSWKTAKHFLKTIKHHKSLLEDHKSLFEEGRKPRNTSMVTTNHMLAYCVLLYQAVRESVTICPRNL